jgi:hypothetical protein
MACGLGGGDTGQGRRQRLAPLRCANYPAQEERFKENRNNSMSDENWITPDKPVYALCDPPGEDDAFRWGLLWGRGNPGRANLGWDNHWAVVKITSYRESPADECIEFKDYELVFEGGRVEAVNKLISLGADPAGISLEIEVREDASVALTGFYGTSIVAGDGFADAGACGYACAGAGGLARVYESGTAVAGDRGLAIVEGKRYGSATAGDRGIAIGEGRFKRLSVGDGGVAIASSGRLWLGDGGVGIGDAEIFGREESIAIGGTVYGGPGSVLIARNRVLDPETDEYKWQVACGIVGRDGIRPWVQYTVQDGVLVQLKEETDE